jgi:hypothetical protein
MWVRRESTEIVGVFRCVPQPGPWSVKPAWDEGHEVAVRDLLIELSISVWKLSPVAGVYFTGRAPRRLWILSSRLRGEGAALPDGGTVEFRLPAPQRSVRFQTGPERGELCAAPSNPA